MSALLLKVSGAGREPEGVVAVPVASSFILEDL